MRVHEPLHQQPLVGLGCIECPLDLDRAAVERLLAQDMLARLDRAHRPLDVHRVRERDVDGLDIGVLEQRLVASVRTLDPVLARVCLCAVAVAAADGDELHAVRLARAGEDEIVDAGSREQAPRDRLAFLVHPSSKCFSAG